MATTQYLNLEGLQKYDELIKGLIGTDKIPSTATEKTVVEYLLAQVSDSEFSGKASDVSIDDTDGKITATTVEGALGELATAIATLNGDVSTAGSVAKALADKVGTLKIGETDYTTVVGYVNAMCVGIKNIIANETGDISGLTTTNKSTIVAAINEVDAAVKAVDFSGKADKVASATNGNFAGLDSNGNLTDSGKKAADFEVAGAAAAVQGNTTSTVKDVVDAIGVKKAEGVNASGLYKYVDEAVEAVDSTTANAITISTESTSTGMLKSYQIYQGGSEATNLIGTIDIPKDLVVSSGEVVTNPEGQTAGTYIKLTIANQDSPLFINVKDLVDVYTAQASATQVQLAVSSTNEISAAIVAGSITATELAETVKTDIAKGQSALDAIGTGYAIGGNDATVKAYIDSRIFVGTQEQVNAAKTAKTIDDSTFIVVTDTEADGVEAIDISDITALFA